MAFQLLLPYCKDLNQSTPPVMLLLGSPLWALLEGIEEGSSITHQKASLGPSLLSQKHIQSCLLRGIPLLSLKKVLPVGRMLHGVNKEMGLELIYSSHTSWSSWEAQQWMQLTKDKIRAIFPPLPHGGAEPELSAIPKSLRNYFPNGLFVRSLSVFVPPLCHEGIDIFV